MKGEVKMAQIQKPRLTKEQDQIIYKLASKSVALKELQCKAKKTEAKEEIIEKEERDIKRIREEIESWEVFQNSKELINNLIEALKRRYVLLRMSETYYLDCSQCVFVGNCDRGNRKPIYCFNKMNGDNRFNEFGYDKNKIAICEQMVKETFK